MRQEHDVHVCEVQQAPSPKMFRSLPLAVVVTNHSHAQTRHYCVCYYGWFSCSDLATKI